MTQYQKVSRATDHLTGMARPTIGLIMCRALTDSRAFQVWLGVSDIARQRNLNLFTFPLHTHDAPHRDQDNVLLELISPRMLDGLAVYHWWGTESQFEDIVAPFQPLPIVSITHSFEKFYSVIDDNYGGMRLAVRHLIEVHDRRRLVYLHGPETCRPSKKRFQGYVDELAEHGMTVDPQLLTPYTSVTEYRGAEMIRLLIDKRKLRPGIDFDAVVARSDELALSAMQELRKRGVQIPYDVAVVGYDGIDECQTATPPMTSVLLPFHNLGQRAAMMLADILDGQSVPEPHVIAPPQLIVRQSCGCLSSEILWASSSQATTASDDDTCRATKKMRSFNEIASAIGDATIPSEWIQMLVESLTEELHLDQHGHFLEALDKVLRQVVEAERDVTIWENVISVLRCHTLPALDQNTRQRAEDLWQQARVMVAEIFQWEQIRQKEQAMKYADFLREIGQALITTFDTTELMTVLARQLPRLGIRYGYLALYDKPQTPGTTARLVLAYNEDGQIDLPPEGQHFPASLLVPQELLPQNHIYDLIVKPLYFRQEQIGFAVFDTHIRSNTVYEILRGQISSALQGALLVQRVQERSAEIVRQKYILDTFMANVPDSIYFKDRESRITHANQAHARAMGMSDPADEVGKTDFDFFPEDQARPKYEQEQAIMQTGQPLLAIEEPNAGGRWSLTTKMPLRDEHGVIIGTFGISRDITDLKRAHAEIQQHAHELAAAYEEINVLNRQLEHENLRMGAELDVVKQLQQMILPQPHELTQISDLDITGYMQPADEVGGDYYDVLNEHGILHIGIGDVTGHGLESGVLMLMTQTAIRTLIEHGETDPVKFVNTLNRLIYKNAQRMGTDKNLTFALVQCQQGHLKLVGQHEELLVVRQGGQIERVDTMDLGFPVGLEPEISDWVHAATITLHSGDGIVLYTDGITEAENTKKEFYGIERLCEVISHHWDRSAEEIKQATIDDITRFIGKQKIYDDLTLVILKQK